MKYQEDWDRQIRVYEDGKTTVSIESREVELNSTEAAKFLSYFKLDDGKLKDEDTKIMMELIRKYYRN